MPEWLLKKDNYTPLKDNTSFINKSILSLIHVLTRFRIQTDIASQKNLISPLMKLLWTLAFVIFLCLSKSFAFVLVANVIILVLLNFLKVSEIKYVLRTSLFVWAFTSVILLPSFFLGYGNNILVIILKVLATVSSVNIFACTTHWADLTSTLKMLHIPDMFIFVLDISIRYIMILGEFALNMIYATKLRSIGKVSKNGTSVFGTVGTMFLKSKKMSEEMYGAMECRGFTGEYKVYKKFRFKAPDYLCIVLIAVFILTYFYFDRL